MKKQPTTQIEKSQSRLNPLQPAQWNSRWAKNCNAWSGHLMLAPKRGSVPVIKIYNSVALKTCLQPGTKTVSLFVTAAQ